MGLGKKFFHIVDVFVLLSRQVRVQFCRLAIQTSNLCQFAKSILLSSCLSFPRKRESKEQGGVPWIPAFAGMTMFRTIFTMLFFLSQTSIAQAQNLDAVQLLRNLSNQLDPWFTAVEWSAYMMGFVLMFKALYHLKVYGELRTMMSRETSLKTPLTWMAVGAAFILLPSTVNTVMQSTFSDPRILMYPDWQGATTGSLAIAEISIFRIVQFVGLVSFVRGMMIITKAAQQGTQQRIGKGVTHVIAGILGMNIVATANMMATTFGLNS